MAKFLVRGRIKPAKKAELASHLAEGTLAQGAPFQQELLQALREGHATDDVAYFMVEAPGKGLGEKRAVLEGFFDIERVLPVSEVSGARMAALEGEDGLPDWAGVD